MNLDLPIVVASSALVGCLIGSTITRRLSDRHHVTNPAAHDQVTIELRPDPRIREVAEQWAIAQGRPEAAPLLAGKLDLASRILEMRAPESRPQQEGTGTK